MKGNDDLDRIPDSNNNNKKKSNKIDGATERNIIKSQEGDDNEERYEGDINLINFFLDDSNGSLGISDGDEGNGNHDNHENHEIDDNQNNRRDDEDPSSDSDDPNDSDPGDSNNEDNNEEEDRRELTIEELKREIMRRNDIDEINQYLKSIKNRSREGIEWRINEENIMEENLLKAGFKRIGIIEAGVEICGECFKMGTNANGSLVKHFKDEHDGRTAKMANWNEFLTKIIDRPEIKYWTDNTEEGIYLNDLMICPLCHEATSTETNIKSHISTTDKKKGYENEAKDRSNLGWFWTIIRKAWRKEEEIPKIKDFIKTQEIYVCPYCAFGTNNITGLKSHEKQRHDLGQRDPTSYKTKEIKNLITIEGREWNLEEIERSISNYNEQGRRAVESSMAIQRGEYRRRIERNNIVNNEERIENRNEAALNEEIEYRNRAENRREAQDRERAAGMRAYLEVEDLRNQENNRREINEDERNDENNEINENNENDENRRHRIERRWEENEEEIINDDPNHIETPRERRMRMLREMGPQKTTEEILDICNEASRRYENEEEKGIFIPSLVSFRMEKIIGQLKMVVDTFEEFEIEAMKHLSEDYERNMRILEGLECKFTLEVIRVIKEKLRIDGRANSNERNRSNERIIEQRNEIEELKKVTTRSRGLNKVSGYLEKIKNKFNNMDELNQENRNWLEKQVDKIKKIIEEAGGSEVIVAAYGEFSRDKIIQIVESARTGNDNELRWLKEELRREQDILDGEKGKKYTKIVRTMYKENGKRCMRYYINPNITPNCPIETNEIQRFYEEEFSIEEEFNKELEQSPNWWIEDKDKISPEDNEEIRRGIRDDKAIERALMSRDNLSACGNDGIANRIWKYAKTITIPLIREMLTNMYESGICPLSWKKSKTILLYKKGDANNNRSWRPISLTLTLYRAAMCHLSNVLQRIKFLCPQQKGFRRGIDGASEHINVVDQLMTRAKINRRSMYIMTLDFKNAFGSVPHEMILEGMRKFGFEEKFITMTEALYNMATTKIWVNGETTEDIQIRRGVKQGCPMSPWYFNVCIDILLRWLNKKNRKDGIYFEDHGDLNDDVRDNFARNGVRKGTKYYFVAQAYADDVILMSYTEDGMKRILKTVDEFCTWSKMKLAPQKCHCIHYAFVDRQNIRQMSPFYIGPPKEDGTRDSIDVGEFDETTDYLGIKLGFWGNVRKRKMKDTIDDVIEQCDRVINSPLTFSQKIDCLKRRILTQLDYALLNGNFPTKLLEKADEKIRAMIDRNLKSQNLPVDFFYTRWRDGGLDLPNLKERYALLQIRNLIKISCSEDENIRALERTQWREECTKRQIIEVEDSPYLGLPVNIINDEIDHGRGNKVDSLHIRAARALKELNLSLRRIKTEEGYDYYLRNRYNEGRRMNNRENNNEGNEGIREDETNKEIRVNYKSFLKIGGTMVRNNHYRNLTEKTIMKGQAFIDIKEDIISNHFMRDEGQMMYDGDVRFAILARTQCIYTPSKDRINNECKKCNQGKILTLGHLLNGCLARKPEYTRRHNAVQAVFRDHLERKIIRNKDVVIRENCTISKGEQRLSGEERDLKPDLWYIKGNEITIVEFTIPFGQNTTERIDGEIIETRTLERARKQKENKYKTLVEKCQTELGLETRYFTIIISSLGAMINETRNALREIFGEKSYRKIARELVRTAINKSKEIYIEMKRDADQGQNEEEGELIPMEDNINEEEVDRIEEIEDIYDEIMSDEDNIRNSDTDEAEDINTRSFIKWMLS